MKELNDSLQYKISWYDGWLYAKFLDPVARHAFNRTILRMLDSQDHVIEIGCGTGALALGISHMCSRVVGVDSSPRMIEYAEKLKKKGNYDNVEFRLTGKNAELAGLFNGKFDCAIIKMVLHENDNNNRQRIMDNVKKVSHSAIIVDWDYGQSWSFFRFATRIIEFMAGREHYRNYLDWCSLGGLSGFIEKQKLKVIMGEKYKNNTGKIVKVSW